MNVFIDGLIFGRQRCGGISRVWEEYLTRLPDLGTIVQLLLPGRRDNFSLQRILAQKKKFAWVGTDYFFWPKRVFEGVELRSRVLESLYLQKSARIFHSTFFSTVYRADIKKVVTVHDMILELNAAAATDQWTQWGIENKKKVLANADAIVAVSQNTKQELLRIYPFIPEERVSVICSGVSKAAKMQKTSFADLAARHGWRFAAKEYFLYVGLRSGYKNFSLLPRLIAGQRSKEFLFVCVGGEKPTSDLRRLHELQLADRFVFIENADDDQLNALYRHARALIVPSFHEGFGLPILEAMANDCPVLCSDIPVFHEVGGDAAVFFNPAMPETFMAALERLQGSDCETMIRRGRANAEKFSWDDAAKKMVALYGKLTDVS